MSRNRVIPPASAKLGIRSDRLEPRQRGSIQVYELLRENILWLEIEPGSALDELALAARFQVSRTPIREALLLLSGDQLVKFLPNRTTIVAPLHMNNFGPYLDTYLVLSRSVMRTAARRFRQTHEPELRRSLDAIRQSILMGEPKAALRADLGLRRRIAALAGNEFLERCYNQILDAGIRAMILHFFPNAGAGDLARALANGDRLINALQARDAARADSLTRTMIENEAAVILRSFAPTDGTDFDFPSITSLKEADLAPII